jgi:hypothetical protein
MRSGAERMGHADSQEFVVVLAVVVSASYLYYYISWQVFVHN